jgi:hypothetical protein
VAQALAHSTNSDCGGCHKPPSGRLRVCMCTARAARPQNWHTGFPTCLLLAQGRWPSRMSSGRWPHVGFTPLAGGIQPPRLWAWLGAGATAWTVHTAHLTVRSAIPLPLVRRYWASVEHNQAAVSCYTREAQACGHQHHQSGRSPNLLLVRTVLNLGGRRCAAARWRASAS